MKRKIAFLSASLLKSGADEQMPSCNTTRSMYVFDFLDRASIWLRTVWLDSSNII